MAPLDLTAHSTAQTHSNGGRKTFLDANVYVAKRHWLAPHDTFPS